MRRRIGLVAAIVAAVVWITAAVVWPDLYAWMAVGQIRAQLDQVPPGRAEQLLAEAARLGDRGIGLLVEALGSDRPGVAQAARAVLDGELRRWESLQPEQSAAKLAALAAELARRVAQFDPAARQSAADLATRILLWPSATGEGEPLQLIAHCEQILRAAGEADSPPPRPQQPLRMAEAPLAPEHLVRRGPTDLWADPAAPGWYWRQIQSRHGQSTAQRQSASAPQATGTGPLPRPRSSPLAPSPGVAAEAGRSQGASEERPARGGEIPTQRQPQALVNQPAELPVTRPASDEGPLQRPRAQGRIAPAILAPAPDALPPESDAGPQAADPSAARRWAELSNLELMRYLASGDTSVTTLARGELARRGFSPVQIELAEKLFDPDPGARRELVELLPQLQSVRPEPWLRLLVEDTDPEVRRRAAAALSQVTQPAAMAGRGAGQSGSDQPVRR